MRIAMQIGRTAVLVAGVSAAGWGGPEVGAVLFAQSAGVPGALPATQPTAGSGQGVVQRAATRDNKPSDNQGLGVGVEGLEVVCAGGELSITANGAGLMRILNEIARQTGMKIIGSVADERVYGRYGPADAGRVLASLLEGTGTNMMLEQTAADTPAELILSSRNGGPMPLGSSAGPQYGGSRSEGLRGPQTVVPRAPAAPPGGRQQQLWAPAVQQGIPQAAQDAAGNGTASSPAPVYAAQPAAAPSAEPTAAPEPAGSGDSAADPASPNGVKSPQQIYMELQQLQQQQTKP